RISWTWFVRTEAGKFLDFDRRRSHCPPSRKSFRMGIEIVFQRRSPPPESRVPDNLRDGASSPRTTRDANGRRQRSSTLFFLRVRERFRLGIELDLCQRRQRRWQ